ncbi:hypothetical protein VMCG_07357 [Cytospora schulzeri]|uniref:Uncharacterized protein n=1 Tax=Cytospora schulzeri TaxID=448051 RepID=A0A423W2X1_9PEZI|nr:hypothetical protein VMCG_07357 [Valsa malicola]
MPPAIEEEEELLYESSSENAASPQQLVGEDVLIDISDGSKQPSQQLQREPSPLPVVSDIPLVVSDIPQAVDDIPNGVTAPPPQTQTQPSKLIEKGAPKPTKRKASPKGVWIHQGRSEKDMCQSSHGQPGLVMKQPVPPHGIEPVTNLMKAAQEVTQSIALLAAYEAAIGPALRSIAGVTLPPSEKGRRGPRKKKVDKKPAQGTGSTKPTIGTNNGSRPWQDEKRSTTQQHRGHPQQQHTAGSEPASLLALPQANLHHHHTTAPPPPPPHQSAHDPETFERMERQALRRRKVEALESLAHTAALFLAEFMDFRKGQAAPSSTSNGTGGPPPQPQLPPRVDPGAGSAYAAAAAGMAASLFQPPAGEEEEEGENGWQHDGAGKERSGWRSESEGSASGSDGDDDDNDDGDIPAKVALSNGNADEEEYDSEETGSEDVGDYKMGSETDQEESNVKVEEE